MKKNKFILAAVLISVILSYTGCKQKVSKDDDTTVTPNRPAPGDDTLKYANAIYLEDTSSHTLGDSSNVNGTFTFYYKVVMLDGTTTSPKFKSYISLNGVVYGPLTLDAVTFIPVTVSCPNSTVTVRVFTKKAPYGPDDYVIDGNIAPESENIVCPDLGGTGDANFYKFGTKWYRVDPHFEINISGSAPTDYRQLVSWPPSFR